MQPYASPSAQPVQIDAGMRVMRPLPPAVVLLAFACASPSADDPDASSSGDTTSSTITGMGTASSTSASTSTVGDASSGPDSTSAGPTDGSESSSDDGPVVPPPTCGALAEVPSDPGPHIAEIEALADDSWLALGPPAADPTFGAARGRSWGGRAFALAPDLRGAFFTGEGVHAYVKPDGFGMDDIWFYDLHAHAWIAVHPGNEIATFNQRVTDGTLSIDEYGQLQDGNGNPVPLHVLIHAWDFVTYDTATQSFAFLASDGMGRYFMPGEETIDEGLTALEAQREGIAVPPMSPWRWSTADCVFERHPISTSPPGSLNSDYGAFVYASASDQYVYAAMSGVGIYDRTSDEWTIAADTGPRPTGYDNGVAYDPTRNRLYIGPGNPLYVYDIATSTWTNPTPSGQAPNGIGTNSASVFYDAIGDVITVFHYVDRTHYTYDPVGDAWTSSPLPDEMLDSVGYASFNAFYDPVTNAYFVYAATDSEDNGTMWAYRRAG